MKNIIIGIVVFGVIMAFYGVAGAADPYNFQVKTLYANPGADNKVVYDIPIEVRMLDASEDMNWYKVKIQFNLGPACFKYTGWAYIPVGSIIAEREAKKQVAVISK